MSSKLERCVVVLKCLISILLLRKFHIKINGQLKKRLIKQLTSVYLVELNITGCTVHGAQGDRVNLPE